MSAIEEASKALFQAIVAEHEHIIVEAMIRAVRDKICYRNMAPFIDAAIVKAVEGVQLSVPLVRAAEELAKERLATAVLRKQVTSRRACEKAADDCAELPGLGEEKADESNKN